MKWRPCEHGTAADFKDEDGLWVCSACGKRGKWSATWGYYGNVECKKCWMAAMDFVYCSDECRETILMKDKKAQIIAVNPRRYGKKSAMIEASVERLVDVAKTREVAVISVWTSDEDAVFEIMLKAERMGLHIDFHMMGGGWIIEAMRPAG